jgi:hypothetical protein
VQTPDFISHGRRLVANRYANILIGLTLLGEASNLDATRSQRIRFGDTYFDPCGVRCYSVMSDVDVKKRPSDLI